MPFPVPYDQETQLLVAEAHAEIAYAEGMIRAAQAVVDRYASQIGEVRALAAQALNDQQSDGDRELLQLEAKFLLDELASIEAHATYDGRSFSGGGRVWVRMPDRVAHQGVDGIEIPLPTLCSGDDLDTRIDMSTMPGAYEAIRLAADCLDALDADARALAEVAREAEAEASAVVAEFGPVGTVPGCETDRHVSVAIVRTESALAVATEVASAIASTRQQVSDIRDTARAGASERLTDRERAQLEASFLAALESLDTENHAVRWDGSGIAEGSLAVWPLELPQRVVDAGMEPFDMTLPDLTISSLGIDGGRVSVSTSAEAQASVYQLDACLDELDVSGHVLAFQAERLATTLEHLDAACADGN